MPNDTPSILLDRLLAGLDNLARIEQHLARLVELAEAEAPLPRSFITDDDPGPAAAMDQWIRGRK
jgi:hypothetical protein